MSGFVAKRKVSLAGNKEGIGGRGKKIKTVDIGEEISKKIMSKYEKMNEELNKAVGTYLCETEVKVKTENDSSLNFTELIRSKIRDLEEDEDQEGDISDEEENSSKDESNDIHTIFENNKAMDGLNTSDLMLLVKTSVISDIVKIQTQVVESLSRKDEEIEVLKVKLERTETEKVALGSKYRKYKEMAVKLSANGNKSDNKDLEDENSNLRDKLKTILDKLSNEEELKCDVSSKLALKDQMLKEQIKKNQELEVKIKNFVMSFFDKMETSSKEGAVANLNKSMEESKISDYLEKSNKSLNEEISTKLNKTKIKMMKESIKSEEMSVKSSNKLKKLQVDIQNIGYDTLKKESMKNRGNISRNVTKQSFPYDSEKSRINFGVLNDKEVVSSKMQNLINETDSQNKSKLGEASSPASLVRYQTSEGENQGKRKDQIRNLSNEISKKKYEIKRLSYECSSPSSRKDPEYFKESFELLPAVDDDSEVPLKVKIVNMNSDQESEAKEVNNVNFGSKLSVNVLKKYKPNSSLEIQSSPKTVILNPNVSIQKKLGRKLRAKLMNNSSISVGRSEIAQDATSLEESKKKNEKVPLSLPGITMMNSIGISNPGISIQKSSEALESNSSISFKKVSQSPSPALNKVHSVGLPRNSAISFNRVSTPEGNTNFSRSIKEFPALGNLNLSISRPSEQGNTPKRRLEHENYTPKKHSETRNILKRSAEHSTIPKIPSEQVNTPNISTEERGNRPKKAKEQRNQPKEADEQINTFKRPVEHNTPKISSSTSFKPSSRRDSLSRYSQLSISKSRVSADDENLLLNSSSSEGKATLLKTNMSISVIKPSEDNELPTDKPVSGLLLNEIQLVKIPSDVLKDVDNSIEEHIPWEASDHSTEVIEPNAIEGETKSTPDDGSVDGHYDMTKYDYLMEKINSQLKNISEKNHQSELKIKELQHNDDNEIEKLLMD